MWEQPAEGEYKPEPEGQASPAETAALTAWRQERERYGWGSSNTHTPCVAR